MERKPRHIKVTVTKNEGIIMSDLLEDVKNFLDITWDMDIRERKKLSGIVERGKAYLEGKIGFCDFEKRNNKKKSCS